MADHSQRRSSPKATHSCVGCYHTYAPLLHNCTRPSSEFQEKRTEQAQILQMRPNLRQNLSDRLYLEKSSEPGWGGRAGSGIGNMASFNIPWYMHC